MRRIFWFVCILLISFLSYGGAARLGLVLATINANTSPVWPASGLAVVLVLWGRTPAALGVFLGAFTANWATGLSPLLTSSIAAGNLMEALAGALLFRHLQKHPLIRDVVMGLAARYALVAFIPTMISASVGTVVLWFAGRLAATEFLYSWLTWWVGDMLGVVFVFPLIRELITYLGIRKYWWKKLTVLDVLHFVVVFSSVPLLTWLVFGTAHGGSFLFIIFFSLLFVAMFLPYWSVYLGAAVLSVLAILLTKNEHGPFSGGALNDSLMHLQFFLAGVWLTTMVLANLKRLSLLRGSRLAFAIGWILTGTAFYSFYEGSTKRSQNQFQTRVQEAKRIVENTMNGYVHLLEAGAAYFDGSEKVSRQEWHLFIEGLKIEERYPGLRGLGVIFMVDEKQVPAFEKEQQKTNPDFKVHGFPGARASTSSQKMVITYIEPWERNKAAVGLDISSEENRRLGALEAARRGEPVLTEEVMLVQDALHGEGFLLFMPVYREVSGRLQLYAYIFAPIVAEDFISAVAEPFQRELLVKKVALDGPVRDSYSEDVIYLGVRLAGRSVQLEWRRGPEFETPSYMASSLAGFCGAFFTLVLGAFIASIESLQKETAKTLEKRTAEIQNRESLWRTLTEVSPVGIFILDPQSQVAYTNQRLSQITGLDFSNFKSGSLSAAIHADDRESVMAQWREFLVHQTEFSCNYRLHVEKGLRHINSHVVPIQDDHGTLIGFLGTLQDTTELHQNQSALAAAARLSSLGQMAGGIAHEINNPLAVISGRLEVMKMYIGKNNFDSEKLLADIEKAQKTVFRIARIITALRSVAREPGAEELVRFSVDECLQETLELCEKKFQIQGVDLRVKKLADNSWAWGRPEQVGQVLLNLLNNALDAAGEYNEKWVEVEISQEENEVVLSVIDSGYGIPAKVVENIFNPFFTTKQVGEGMGLGLSISKGIAERQGGFLLYDPKAPRTTFRLVLKRG